MESFKSFITEKTKMLAYLKAGDWFVHQGKNYQVYKTDSGPKVYVKDETGAVYTIPSDWKVDV